MVADDARLRLEEIATGLRLDGFDLDVHDEGDQLVVAVVAGPEACPTCLVPKDAMAAMVGVVLGPHHRFELRYPADGSPGPD